MVRRVTLPVLAIGFVFASSCSFKHSTDSEAVNAFGPDAFGFVDPPNLGEREMSRYEKDPELESFYEKVREANGTAYLVARPRGETRIVHVRVPIPEDSVIKQGDTEYADIPLGITTARIMKKDPAAPPPPPPPTPIPPAPPGDHGSQPLAIVVDHFAGLVLKIPDETDGPLSSFVVRKTYKKKRDASAELHSVSVLDVKDDHESLVTIRPELVIPGGQDCDADTITQTPGLPSKFDVDTPEFVGCIHDECTLMNAAWWRASHDVQILQDMLGYIAENPQYEPAELWGQNWLDEAGAEIPGTSFEYWFGPYTKDRFLAVQSVLNEFWLELQEPGQWVLACREPSDATCNQAAKPAAFHKPEGTIGLCRDRFFVDASEEAYARQPFNHVRLAVHEAIHFQEVKLGDELKEMIDSRKHQHGPNCDDTTKKLLNTGICPVMHLAQYPVRPECEQTSDGCTCVGSAVSNCNHGDLAVTNADTYGFATAWIGEGIRRNGAHHWPDVGDLNFSGAGGCPDPPLATNYECTEVGPDYVCELKPNENLAAVCE